MLNKKIEYFVTLAECLSFTQAAAAHSVSQTAISQYIASLEAKLQVRLFNRNAHAVSLTDAGKFFYERVTFMLRYESDTKKRLIAIAEQYSGYVKEMCIRDSRGFLHRMTPVMVSGRWGWIFSIRSPPRMMFTVMWGSM